MAVKEKKAEMLEGVMEQVTSREHQRQVGHTASLRWRREERKDLRSMVEKRTDAGAHLPHCP